MTRFAIPVLLALGLLTGCTPAQTTTADNAAITTVAGAQEALAAANAVADRYVIQPACPAGKVAWTCSDKATVDKIKAASLVAYNDINKAKAGVITLQAALVSFGAFQATLPPAN